MWIAAGPGIEVFEAESSAQFVSLLRRSNSCWWNGESMPWAFRGHADETWALLPSAWRPGNTIIEAGRKEATDRFDRIQPQQHLRWIFPPNNFNTGNRAFGGNDAALARQLAIDANAELLPLWDFASSCNDIGLNTPMPSVIDPNVESDWLHMAAFPLIADEVFWYSDIPAGLALAQHHGLPTRLLDWSVNPIASVFFAVEGIAEPEAGRKIAVWALNRINAAKVKMPGVIFPNGLDATIQPGVAVFRPPIRDNPYLAAQSGLFTGISGSGIHYMQSGGVRPSLDEFVVAANMDFPVLRKITLAHEHVPGVAEIMLRERINRASFMPTLDNVSSDVKRRWTLRNVR